jgi:uncharacterized protein YecE (DUF72 family)
VGRLHYGTSSWSEKTWVGPFYPRGTPPGSFLTHYARRYSTVEADVTYYRVPDARLVEGWDRKTPDGFILSAKFPRSIVHGGAGARPDAEALLVLDRVGEDLEEFLMNMGQLGPKCGPLILQFPYFNRQVFPGPEPFLDRLDSFLAGLPADFRYGVEIRNRWWVKPPLLDILRRHRTALVLVDIAYMPHPAKLAESLDLVTTDFLYCRLIGDRKAVEERADGFDKIVVDQTQRLEGWSALLQKMLDRVHEIYVYANNHYAGYGPATIDTLQDMVTEQRGKNHQV